MMEIEIKRMLDITLNEKDVERLNNGEILQKDISDIEKVVIYKDRDLHLIKETKLGFVIMISLEKIRNYEFSIKNYFIRLNVKDVEEKVVE